MANSCCCCNFIPSTSIPSSTTYPFWEDYAGQRLPIPVSLEFDSDVFAFPVLRPLYYAKTFCGLSTIQVSSTTGKGNNGETVHLAFGVNNSHFEYVRPPRGREPKSN